MTLGKELDRILKMPKENQGQELKNSDALRELKAYQLVYEGYPGVPGLKQDFESYKKIMKKGIHNIKQDIRQNKEIQRIMYASSASFLALNSLLPYIVINQLVLSGNGFSPIDALIAGTYIAGIVGGFGVAGMSYRAGKRAGKKVQHLKHTLKDMEEELGLEKNLFETNMEHLDLYTGAPYIVGQDLPDDFHKKLGKYYNKIKEKLLVSSSPY